MTAVRRVRAILVLAIGLSLSVVACSQGQLASPSAAAQPTDPSAAPSSSTGTVASGSISPGASLPAEESVPPIESGELVVWASEPVARALKPLADRFAADEGVTVTIESFSDDLVPSFLTASNAGASPDLIAARHQDLGQLLASAAIQPITGSGNSFDPIATRALTSGGKQYGVPYSMENLGLIIDTDLAPTCPATMEDLVAAGKALVKAGKATDILALQVGTAGDAFHLYPLFASGGGSLFGTTAAGDPDPTKVTVDDDGSIAAGKLIQSLGAKGAKALKTTIDGATAIPSFFGRQTAFLVSGPWAVPDIQKASVPMAVCPIPPWKGKTPAGPLVNVNGFYLASHGQSPTLAGRFLDTVLAGNDAQLAMAGAEGRRPALLAAQPAYAAAQPIIASFGAAAAGGIPVPPIPAVTQVWAPLGAAEVAILAGGNVEKALRTAATAIRDGIARQ